MIKTICVFCGSRNGDNPSFIELAKQTGEAFASMNIDIVYGGSKMGLMGAVADGSLDKGGHVVGVFPSMLTGLEIPHQSLTELILTDSLGARKERMIELSDAFLILPGGYGTLDEFFEVVTTRNLSLHLKPVFVLNFEGFWDGILAQLDQVTKKGFVKFQEECPYIEVKTVEELIQEINLFTKNK
ncbi:MAG: TIGR00730 family Rossman fold protein [Pseudomonadota bacterium]